MKMDVEVTRFLLNGQATSVSACFTQLINLYYFVVFANVYDSSSHLEARYATFLSTNVKLHGHRQSVYFLMCSGGLLGQY